MDISPPALPSVHKGMRPLSTEPGPSSEEWKWFSLFHNNAATKEILEKKLNEIKPENIDKKDSYGCSALFLAISNNLTLHTQFLLENGAAPNQFGEKNIHPFVAAINVGNPDILLALLKTEKISQWDIDMKYLNPCPAWEAVFHKATHNPNDFSPLVEYLDFSLIDADGNNVLHYLARCHFGSPPLFREAFKKAIALGLHRQENQMGQTGKDAIFASRNPFTINLFREQKSLHDKAKLVKEFGKEQCKPQKKRKL